MPSIQEKHLFAYAKKLFTEHETFQRQFFDNRDVIAGELKIITYPFTATEWLIPHLKDYMKKYPEVNIKILLEANIPNPAEADIVMSSYIPYQSHLIQKPLFHTRSYLFASKEYLKKYGTPLTAEDLNHHRLIIYKEKYYSSDRSNNLAIYYGLKDGEAPRKAHLETPSLRGLINSALEGYGIVELPNYSLILNSGLIRVFPEVQGEEVGLFFTFSESRKKSEKINKLYEYLAQKGK